MSERQDMNAAEHARMRSQILAIRAGLLSESESDIVRSHLENCTSCRELERELASEPGGSGQHIPMELLAAWPKASQTLRGLERRSRHISRCDHCRARLEVLGYAQVLTPAGSAEERADALCTLDELNTRDSRHAEPSAPRPSVAHPIRPRRPDWGRWALGGWAVAASIAAILLVLRPGQPRIAAPERRTGEPPHPAEVPYAAPAAAVHLLDLPAAAVLSAAERSPGQRPALATTAASGHVICLLLPAQGLHPSEVAGVDMDLVDSKGSVVWAQSQSVDRFTRPRRLSIDLALAGWRAGRHTLRLTIHPSPSALVHEPDVREFPFEVAPTLSANLPPR